MAVDEHLPGGGSVGAAISNAVVGILHDWTGRGPTQARTLIGEDVVVVLVHDTLTKGERRLVEEGEDRSVLGMRGSLQRTMRDDLVAAVEQLTSRPVMAFMSANHADPDLAAEIFVLESDPA
jgi:uncharacterized protein YbcI